jgi:hypothetical protein
VRYRNPGVGRRGNSRCNAGNDLEGERRFGERLRFFTASAEHQRVASLESNDALSLANKLHEQLVDRVLR